MHKSSLTFNPQNQDRFESGLIDRADHPDFDAVYRCYQHCFPLPTEQESQENFLAILAENQDARKPGREIWVYLKDKLTGEVLGADNFDAFAAAPGSDINGTCQDIYMFVDERFRQQGIYAQLIALREQATAKYLQSLGVIEDASQAKICTFAEQNNPLLMTPAQYLEDTDAAIDQCLRRSIFERSISGPANADERTPGFRTIQMRYVQPPLDAEGGEVCDYLDYVVKLPDDRTTIPAEIVRGHLARFFEKSFPAGTSLETAGLEGMKRDLHALRDLTLEPAGKFDPLGESLNVDTLRSWPAAQQDVRIGELRPDLVAQHYRPGVDLADAMEGYTHIRQQTGHTAGLNPSAREAGWVHAAALKSEPYRRLS